MGYDRNELVTIGERFEPEILLEWARRLSDAAKQDIPRLKARGVSDQFLRELESAREQVRRFTTKSERETSPSSAARRQAIDGALDWREEVQGLAKAVFDSNPDAQARFRVGVRTSRSLPKLIWEIRLLLGALRQHLGDLRGVGANEVTVAAGEDVLRGLEDAQRRTNDDRSPVADLHHAQGVLYTTARFLRRVAEVEFRTQPDRLEEYSYEPLRARETEAPSRQRRPAVIIGEGRKS